MKVFIWEYVGKCSDNYHSGGGVVVFAKDEESARQIANGVSGCEIKAEEKPDEVRESNGKEQIFIFPDAGCC
jgi:hypothetical protein